MTFALRLRHLRQLPLRFRLLAMLMIAVVIAARIHGDISIGMTFAAWITQAQRGSLPRLQLAMLALGLTGLCLGAVVSERKRVERAIRKSEKRYRLLFERNLAGVFRTTLAGRVVECNQAVASMFGYDLPEEVMALKVANLYDTASDREAFLTELKSEKSL